MHYPNAPIREAVFDIRVDKLRVNSYEDLRALKSLIPSEYVTEQTHVNFFGQLQFGPNLDSTSSGRSSPAGFIYSNASNTKKVQFRVDGFTLNILKPYDRWEEHFNECISLWNLYREQFQPSNLVRVGLRFINRIEVGPLGVDMDEFITTMPRIPNSLPQSFSGFFTQVRVPLQDQFKEVVINQTMEPMTTDAVPVILDIDVFQSANLTFENLAENFNAMREIKNRVFESCITDRTRQLFI